MSSAAPAPTAAARDEHGRKYGLDWRAVALLVGCCAIWGGAQSLIKFTIDAVPPLLQAGLRSLLAASCLALWARARGIRLAGADLPWQAGAAAGLLFGIEFGAIYLGLQYTSAARMSVLLYLSPFVVAAGMPFIARSERLAGRQLFGLLLAFAAVVLAFAPGLAAGGAGLATSWRGDLLAIAAALFWGATTLLIRATRLASASPELTLFYQLAFSAIVLLALSLAAGETWTAPGDWPLRAWVALGLLACVVSFASYLVWFWLLRHYPATQVSSYVFLTPVIGVLVAALTLGEAIEARLWVALACIAAGIALVTRRPKAAR
jgi:drug/metabolite transporter (DMT)-like permease